MATCSKKSAAEVNLLGKRKLEDGLETKPIMKRPNGNSDEKETTLGFADSLQQIKGSVELSETKSTEANLVSVKETVEGLEETPDFVEEVAVPKKTLFVGHFSPQTEISDIIDFFKDVGEVVRVRLIVAREGSTKCCAFVEFASSNEAKKALEEKNGEYFHDRNIFITFSKNRVPHLPSRYCIDHKVWYKEDYDLQGESLPIKEDKTSEVLLVANLSPQTTKIVHIIHFFKDVGFVVSVRLMLDHWGKHVGYAFVEFESSYQAKKALEGKNGEYLHDHKILLMKGLDEIPDFAEEVATVSNKTLFVDNLSDNVTISDIIDFFKDVGDVVLVRLFVDRWANLKGYGFVEFASSNEAKKALEKKNGEYLHDSEIFLDVASNGAPYILRPTFCIDHKISNEEDCLQGESLSIELDETPDFAEEVAVNNKTVCVGNLSYDITKISDIIKIFKDVGEVVRARLIVDQWGEHVGCCFVEFASSDEAKQAVYAKDGVKYFVNVAEIAAPYPFRPKYKLAEKLWYEDSIRRELLDLKCKLDWRNRRNSAGRRQHSTTTP